jgi:nucleotide-binding universal stress UspA family protein
MPGILVAVDGCEHSKKLADVGSMLAKTLHTKVILYYVISDPKVPGDYMLRARSEKIPDPLYSYYESMARRVTDNLSTRMKDQGVDCEASYEIGNPAFLIKDEARSRSADMLVVGLHGLHGLAKIRSLGSTARRVIEGADVPVVVVP